MLFLLRGMFASPSQRVVTADPMAGSLWTGYAGDVFPGLTESIDAGNKTSIKVTPITVLGSAATFRKHVWLTQLLF